MSWLSKLQSTVARSTMESEYYAASHAICEALWFKTLVTSLRFSIDRCFTLFIDNQSAIHCLEDPTVTNKAKHIAVNYHFTKEKVERKEVRPSYIPSNENTADIFTKPLAAAKFVQFRVALGMT